MIDISFLSPSPGFGVLQWVMKWEEIGERTIEKLLHALDETVPVAAELALSIAAAITALGATDYKLVAAVDAMTEKEAVAAAQSQGSIYMTARRVGEDAAAGVDSRRREDVVKRLWRMGEGWWLSWPWRSTLVGSGHKHDNPKTKETPEKSLAQYKAGRTLLSRPPRRTEIFEVLSGQELMMFSQPLMIVSGVGFSDHLTLEDLVEVVETQLLAKKERTNVEDDVIHSESENESKPLTVYKHPRLRTVIGKLFGRYCWVRAEDFDVRNHVLKLNRHEALSLLRHHSGGLRSLHQGVLREYEQEKQRPTDEESLPSTFNSGESDGRFKDEIPCDGGNNCKCVVTSAEAQALENILATQALQPSMPLWQFVLLEHVELPALDEGGDSEKEHSDSHKALMQIISYLHVPFTVASLLMLTEEKSWDCPEKPRPPRSGSVWVLQPIRFRLQELKSLRRALAALSPPKEEKCLGDASERLQSNSDTRFCKDRLRRLSQYIVKKPLRNLLVFVARIIRPIAQGTSAYITGLERSTVKQARLGEAQDTPAEADAVDASTTVLMNKKTDSISEVEKGSRKALPKQDLFTINELLATCLVGGICRYVHNKVAMKYAIGERPETLSSKMSKSRSEVLEHPKYSSCGRQQQNNAAQQQAPVTLQATGSLNGTGQNVTDFRSDLSKVGVMTYNKSVSGLSTYSSSTCTSGHRTRAEDHITAEQERRKQILQMELDMLEQLIPQLNIVVPVNLRTTEEESFELRNNFTSAVVQVAAAHAFQAGSAYQRLLGVRKSLRKSVKSLGAHVFALMEKISFCTTPDFLLFLQIWLTKKMSVLFSNVPGPSEQPQIHGRQVHAMHFIGPLAGRISLIVSAFSYADNLDLVITTDTALLESPELLRQCILEEYRELKQLCPPTQLP
ncbi:conserved hypothetical protein [Neospora caninum Liverpool]|uniref:O-acyltransferase WSD1 C-terminal domain-containing protein n=1 Tax=Neospora caninum (strain Liverpool) TaxID=572307 RepID=F0VKR5_NEOCL|nr:conserved hypothetical protein [Neospora caninum Liverpool]CBZ54666.1 conserved hypothetical protein [Neospora caninum Liverpool]|eukprot:XP_003884696.1 conserved hypothetical protein [Neospora caninum Liverpool]